MATEAVSERRRSSRRASTEAFTMAGCTEARGFKEPWPGNRKPMRGGEAGLPTKTLSCRLTLVSPACKRDSRIANLSASSSGVDAITAALRGPCPAAASAAAASVSSAPQSPAAVPARPEISSGEVKRNNSASCAEDSNARSRADSLHRRSDAVPSNTMCVLMPPNQIGNFIRRGKEEQLGVLRGRQQCPVASRQSPPPFGRGAFQYDVRVDAAKSHGAGGRAQRQVGRPSLAAS